MLRYCRFAPVRIVGVDADAAAALGDAAPMAAHLSGERRGGMPTAVRHG